MRRISLFGEDDAHQKIIGTLVQQLADEAETAVQLEWRNAVDGYGAVVREFENYLNDLARQGGYPDLIIVATDANCKGLNERTRELERSDTPVPVIKAIPDPHIERWLLLDGAAFRDVVGHGCDAPDQKCERERYKRLLIEAIYNAGVAPILGGIEFAEDIVRHMDIDRAARLDMSLRRFVSEIRSTFRQWQS